MLSSRKLPSGDDGLGVFANGIANGDGRAGDISSGWIGDRAEQSAGVAERLGVEGSGAQDSGREYECANFGQDIHLEELIAPGARERYVSSEPGNGKIFRR